MQRTTTATPTLALSLVAALFLICWLPTVGQAQPAATAPPSQSDTQSTRSDGDEPDTVEPAEAPFERHLLFRVLPTFLTQDSSTGRVGGFARVSDEDSTGFQLDVEQRRSPRLGLVGGITWARGDTELATLSGNLFDRSAESTTKLLATVGPSLHLFPRRKLDLNLTALAGWFEPGEPPGPIDGDGGLAWGFGIGLDHPLGRGPWGFSARMRWLDSDASYQAPDREDFFVRRFEDGLNVFTAGVGVSYRF